MTDIGTGQYHLKYYITNDYNQHNERKYDLYHAPPAGMGGNAALY
jgi:hypothetical protein